MNTLTEYERLTERVLTLPAATHADRVAYWQEVHADETSTDLLTSDLMCQCCGVDYSGYDRDLLDDPAVGTITPAIDAMFRKYGEI